MSFPHHSIIHNMLLTDLWVGFHRRAGQYKWQICSLDQWPVCAWLLWVALCEGGPPPADSSSAGISYPEPCCEHMSSPEERKKELKEWLTQNFVYPRNFLIQHNWSTLDSTQLSIVKNQVIMFHPQLFSQQKRSSYMYILLMLGEMWLCVCVCVCVLSPPGPDKSWWCRPEMTKTWSEQPRNQHRPLCWSLVLAWPWLMAEGLSSSSWEEWTLQQCCELSACTTRERERERERNLL